MTGQKFTVCLKKFNLSRLVYLQAPEGGPDSGGLLNSLARSALKGQEKRDGINTANPTTKDPADHREMAKGADPALDAKIEADVTRGLNTFGPMSESAMPGESGPKSRISRVSSSVRNGVQGILRKVPIVGKSLARPIHTVKSAVHGAMHPVKTLGNVWRKIRPRRKKDV